MTAGGPEVHIPLTVLESALSAMEANLERLERLTERLEARIDARIEAAVNPEAGE